MKIEELLNRDAVARIKVYDEIILTNYKYQPERKTKFLWITLETTPAGWYNIRFSHIHRTYTSNEEIEKAGLRAVKHDFLIQKAHIVIEFTDQIKNSIYFENNEKMQEFLIQHFDDTKYLTIKYN